MTGLPQRVVRHGLPRPRATSVRDFWMVVLAVWIRSLNEMAKESAAENASLAYSGA
jgi:hypothetical protein